MKPSKPSASELLARNLRSLREDAGLTIRYLGARTGIAVKHLAAIEAASEQGHLDELTLLAAALKVDIAALFAAE